MSPKDGDKIIHEEMGFCCHKNTAYRTEESKVSYHVWILEVCLDCGATTATIIRVPDYAKDLHPVFKWMRDKDLWHEFDSWIYYDYSSCKMNLREFMCLSDSDQRDLIARWIKEGKV